MAPRHCCGPSTRWTMSWCRRCSGVAPTRLRALRRLVEGGAEVDPPPSCGSMAFLWAVHQVDRELVQALLGRGADPDARNVLGATPLAEAVQLGDERLVRMLLDAGADPGLG